MTPPEAYELGRRDEASLMSEPSPVRVDIDTGQENFEVQCLATPRAGERMSISHGAADNREYTVLLVKHLTKIYNKVEDKYHQPSVTVYVQPIR
jgi:hypothetical protein